MIFNSLNFIIFLGVVLTLYYILPDKFRWCLLLISSYYFYMFWSFELIFLIIFSTLINYIFAIKISKETRKKAKKTLIFGLIINFLILFIFKYLVFVTQSFAKLYELFGLNYNLKEFDIILPMGISFYTFQATSYIIDIYRKRYAPEKNFFKLSLYITFFPQLVAGPIERADKLLAQLFTKKEFNHKNISIGLKMMLIGFFKKIVIADRAAILVNTVYSSPNEFTGISFIISTIFFAFQIYCDFSGYSDIAIGCAKLFGIDLMQNFNRPYFSKSIKEFWQRWHISLSTWFKDYLYIPLGGNRCSIGRKYFNLFITFMASGIWHGANWTYIFWGAIHGTYQIVGDIKYRFTKNISFKNIFLIYISNFFKILICFSLVCFAWIFFRANSISEGLYIASNLFNDMHKITDLQYVYNISSTWGLNYFEILSTTFSITFLIIIETFSKTKLFLKLKKFTILRFSFYYILCLIILSLGVFNNAGEFIYFQF